MNDSQAKEIYDQYAHTLRRARLEKGLSLKHASLITGYRAAKLCLLEHNHKQRWSDISLRALVYLFEQYGKKITFRLEPLEDILPYPEENIDA